MNHTHQSTLACQFYNESRVYANGLDHDFESIGLQSALVAERHRRGIIDADQVIDDLLKMTCFGQSSERIDTLQRTEGRYGR